MNRIHVISAGPGSSAYLTGQAAGAIQDCDILYCAERLRTLADHPEKCRNLFPFEPAMEEIAALQNHRVGILVSGDAGLYSLLPMLEKKFGREHLNVIPGISSIQLFCSRLGIPWQDIRILSVHGRMQKPSVISHTVRHNARTLFLLDREHDPQWIAGLLKEGGLTGLRLTVGECLSGPEEAISPYEPREYPSLCLLLAENPAPLPLPVPGLPDSLFLRNKTPMTKRDIRIQVLAALRLQPDSIVYDIGAGTGSVSVECARLCPFGQVYAFEHDPDALDILNQNIRHFHLQNVTVVPGSAPESLTVDEKPGHVFLGGTGRRAEDIVTRLQSLGTPMRLCATAVTLESAHELLRLFSPLADLDVFQMAVTPLVKAGNLHMYRAQNPVTLFSALLDS